MCQIENKTRRLKKLFGYRLYTNGFSQFGHMSMPKLNKRTQSTGADKWHIFTNLKSIQKDIIEERTKFKNEEYNCYRNTGSVSIYKCLLEDNIVTGRWDCGVNIPTATGNKLTILKLVCTI